MRVLPIFTSTLLVLTACASSGTAGGRSTGDVVTRQEIVDANVSTAYDAVQRLRPDWLRSHGSTSLSGGRETAVVYVDGIRYGELGRLREVPAMNVDSIRFLEGRDATTRFGTGHVGGAILVETVH